MSELQIYIERLGDEMRKSKRLTGKYYSWQILDLCDLANITDRLLCADTYAKEEDLCYTAVRLLSVRNLIIKI